MNANCGYQIQQAQTNKILLKFTFKSWNLWRFLYGWMYGRFMGSTGLSCTTAKVEVLPVQSFRSTNHKYSNQGLVVKPHFFLQVQARKMYKLHQEWEISRQTTSRTNAERHTGRWYNQYKIKCYQFHSRKANSGLDFRITILTWLKI